MLTIGLGYSRNVGKLQHEDDGAFSFPDYSSMLSSESSPPPASRSPPPLPTSSSDFEAKTASHRNEIFGIDSGLD